MELRQRHLHAGAERARAEPGRRRAARPRDHPDLRALGAFVGSLVSARLTARFGYGRSLIWSMVAGNTATVLGVIAAIGSPPLAIGALSVAFALSGIGIGVANSQATAIRPAATIGTLLMALATVPIACSPVRRVRVLDEVDPHQPAQPGTDPELVRS